MINRKMHQNTKGFTLIELMIVIAIIGILAAIAIPNFIAYRNKAFCSSTEADANMLAGRIADYFSIPSRTTLPTLTDLGGTGILSGGNTASITGDPSGTIEIEVTDASTRCPDDYQTASNATNNPSGYWDGTTNVFIKTMN
jgi:type IV pilus assembly protein PilA